MLASIVKKQLVDQIAQITDLQKNRLDPDFQEHHLENADEIQRVMRAALNLIIDQEIERVEPYRRLAG